MTRAETEEFLLQAAIVGERRTPGQPYSWRISLDDGKRRHDASVDTEDGTTATERNYRFNAAAYELDNALDLRFVPPSVVRTVNGRPASVTWWVDDVVMSEQDRRRQKIQPPDAERWDMQLQAVRAFDELTANLYRSESADGEVSRPGGSGPPPSYNWGELLITRDWSVWLIDHTNTFRLRRQPGRLPSLTRCDRALLGRLRALNRDLFPQRLARYLSAGQLDALEARRAALVTHFDELIARRGGSAVLYNLPRP